MVSLPFALSSALPGLLAALAAAQCPPTSDVAGMPIVQNSHRIPINSSLNGLAFSFATYVAPNYYNDTTFKPKQGHVWIHGQPRNGDEMVRTYKNSLPDAIAAGLVQESDVVVLSLVFAQPQDEAKTLFSDVLTWCGNNWMEGADANEAAVSSFNVIRAAFNWLGDKYPTITTFVIGGHSAGGQTVQRYAVVQPTDSSPDRYIIANPSSVAYFTAQRPNCNTNSSCSCIATGYESTCCSNFNDWKTGLNNYPHRYQNAAMTASDKSPIINRYIARTIHYLYGTADLGGTANGCTANAQGLNHYDRGGKWWSYLKQNWPQVVNTQTATNITGVGHDSSAMWSSAAGLQRVYGN